MLLEERVVLPDGSLIEIRLAPGMQYSLRYGRGEDGRVSYWSERAGTHRKRVRPVSGGRFVEQAYEFRSVEQLRYDFERDVEEDQRQG